MTKYRLRLPQLQKVSRADALRCLETIHTYQETFLSLKRSRFVFPADEFYLVAQHSPPDFSSYEDFSQLENGVGMIARFRQQIDEVLAEAEALELERVVLVTGISFCPELTCFAARLAEKTGVELFVAGIENHFFGTDVTVTGLITGHDLIAQLQKIDLGDGVIIPDVMLKDQGELFLDDFSVIEIGEKLNCPVIAVETSPWGVLDGLEILAEDGVEIIRG